MTLPESLMPPEAPLRLPGALMLPGLRPARGTIDPGTAARIGQRAQARARGRERLELAGGRAVERLRERASADALERREHLVHRAEALVRVLRHAAGDDLLERGRHLRVRVHLPEGRRLLVHVRHQDVDAVRAIERHLAGEHLVHDDAERVDVRPGVDAVAADLLGRHVLRAAHEEARLRQVFALGRRTRSSRARSRGPSRSRSRRRARRGRCWPA